MTTEFSPVMANKIELWPVDRLRPYEGNARVHDEAQVAQLAASIQQFGFTAPILVDGADGILAGHGRLMAARLAGMTEVPVVVLDHLNEEQQRAYLLADNKLAENSGWDDARLAEELGDLLRGDLDLGALGFSEDELRRLWTDHDMSEFEQLLQPQAPETERADPEEQPELGFGAGLGGDEGDQDEDDGPNRGIALAIVLSPEEMGQWRRAKAELGYSTDKAAFWKLVEDLLEEVSQ
jgi:hypothetical protein